MLWSSSFMFSSRIFRVSSLIFQSLIHFELIFLCMMQDESNFIILHVNTQFSHHHLFNRLSFLHCVFLVSLSVYFSLQFILSWQQLNFNHIQKLNILTAPHTCFMLLLSWFTCIYIVYLLTYFWIIVIFNAYFNTFVLYL